MRLAFSGIALLVASSAHAHSGAHLHPHGGGDWLALVLGAVALGGTVVFAFLRGRK